MIGCSSFCVIANYSLGTLFSEHFLRIRRYFSLKLFLYILTHEQIASNKEGLRIMQKIYCKFIDILEQLKLIHKIVDKMPIQMGCSILILNSIRSLQYHCTILIEYRVALHAHMQHIYLCHKSDR